MGLPCDSIALLSKSTWSSKQSVAIKADTSIDARLTSGTMLAGELDLLAEIYGFVLLCGEEKRAAERSQPGDHDDEKEIKGSGEEYARKAQHSPQFQTTP